MNLNGIGEKIKGQVIKNSVNIRIMIRPFQGTSNGLTTYRFPTAIEANKALKVDANNSYSCPDCPYKSTVRID